MCPLRDVWQPLVWVQGHQHFTADLGRDLGGVTAMHLTKQGACTMGAHMAHRYASSGQQLIRPAEHDAGDAG